MLGMHRRARVWNEFSEYLLETRVLTSSDFNTYPIRFFLHFDVIILCVQMIRTESFHIWTIQRSITEEFTAMVRVTRHILSKEIQLVSITRRQKIVQDMTRATQICLYLLVLLIVYQYSM